MTNKVRKILTQIMWALSLIAAYLFSANYLYAAPPSPLNPGSENAAVISSMFFTVLWVAVGVFVIVEGLLIFAIVRYRRKPTDDPDAMPQQVHGNATLEFIWTIIPAGILVSMFVMALGPLADLRAEPEDAMVVEVIGHQWFWEFRYPDTGIAVNDTLRVPANEPILLEIRSEDVIHSFWVPQLAGKKDAIPGHTNTLWFEVAEEGVFQGQCAELCGVEHYAMVFDVEAISRTEFDSWMQDQVDRQGEPIGTDLESPLPPGDASHGEALFDELGCTSCHSLDGSPLVGPSAQGLGQRAATRKPDYTAEQYIRESILLPCEFVVDTFTCVMPQTFGERFDAQSLSDVMAFLLEQ